MRCLAAWALGLTTAAAAAASTASAEAVAAEPVQVGAAVEPVSAPRSGWVSLSLEAGFPAGGAASLTFRPWPWLRLNAAVLENVISPGVRAGVTLAPFHFAVAPTLTGEVGHYFKGDANGVAREVFGAGFIPNAGFSRFGYDFANAQLGLELGNPDRVVVFVRGGLSYVQTSLTGLVPSAQTQALQLRLVAPSANLGVTVYLF